MSDSASGIAGYVAGKRAARERAAAKQKGAIKRVAKGQTVPAAKSEKTGARSDTLGP